MSAESEMFEFMRNECPPTRKRDEWERHLLLKIPVWAKTLRDAAKHEAPSL